MNILEKLAASDLALDALVEAQAALWASRGWTCAAREMGIPGPILEGFQGLRVLDLGCGPGRLYPQLQPLALEYVGADITKSSLEAFHGKHPEARLIWLRSQELPFLDKTFNLVVCWAVLCHVSWRQVEVIFSESSRVLNNDGQMVATFIEPSFQRADSNWVCHEQEAITKLATQKELRALSGQLLQEIGSSYQTLMVFRKEGTK